MRRRIRYELNTCTYRTPNTRLGCSHNLFQNQFMRHVCMPLTVWHKPNRKGDALSKLTHSREC